MAMASKRPATTPANASPENAKISKTASASAESPRQKDQAKVIASAASQTHEEKVSRAIQPTDAVPVQKLPISDSQAGAAKSESEDWPPVPVIDAADMCANLKGIIPCCARALAPLIEDAP